MTRLRRLGRWTALTLLTAVLPRAALADPAETAGGSDAAELAPYQQVTPAVAGPLRVGGSGTMGRLVKPLVAQFVILYPGVAPQVELQGSNWVPQKLGHGYDVGAMSRPMTDAERAAATPAHGKRPAEVVLASDAILILVNQTNPVASLTLPQLDALYGTDRRAKYAGPVATWGDLGVTGTLAKQPVVRYGIHEQQQGTVETFRRLVLLGGGLDLTVQPMAVPEAEFGQAVAADPAGISYNILHEPVFGARVVPVAPAAGAPPVDPTPDAITAGRYPLTRQLYLYVGPADPVATEFVRFCLSRDGQMVVKGHAAVPVTPAVAAAGVRAVGAAGQ